MAAARRGPYRFPVVEPSLTLHCPVDRKGRAGRVPIPMETTVAIPLLNTDSLELLGIIKRLWGEVLDPGRILVLEEAIVVSLLNLGMSLPGKV